MCEVKNDSRHIYAPVVKSTSNADSIFSAFSQVQDARETLTKVPLVTHIVVTNQKDGCRRDRSRHQQPCFQRQSAHRCTGQPGERLSNH